MFGCCGFLSFSLVFCLLGGRLGPTLYIHFTRRWVESRRHSSAPRRKKIGRKGGKERHSSQCRASGLGAYVEFINRPVRLTDSASPGPAPSGGGVYRLFAATSLCLAPLTTSTAPISASLRRVRSSVSRSRPTPYACTSVRCRLRQPVHEGCPACGGLCGV